jgi:hypothetical protein
MTNHQFADANWWYTLDIPFKRGLTVPHSTFVTRVPHAPAAFV